MIGRHVLVNDATDDGKAYITQYKGESLVDWETDEFNNLVWTRFIEKYDKNKSKATKKRDMATRFREFHRLADGKIELRLLDEDDKSLEKPKIIVTPLDEEGKHYYPVTIVGSRNNKPSVDRMPALKITECAISAYQMSADLKQGLFALAQPTPTGTGVRQEDLELIRESGLGVGAFLATSNEQAKFGYMEYKGDGLKQIKEEIESELETAEKHATRVTREGGVEAAASLIIRTNAQRVTVWTMFNCASSAITRALTIRDKWNVANAKDAIFKINTDFTATHAEATMVTALTNAINAENLPKSVIQEYIHNSGLSKLTAEEMDKQILTGAAQ